jgi:hypothetical protein
MKPHWLNDKNPEAIWFVTHQLECLPETDYEVLSLLLLVWLVLLAQVYHVLN